MPGRLVQAFSFCYDRDHVMDVTGAHTMGWVSQSTDIPELLFHLVIHLET